MKHLESFSSYELIFEQQNVIVRDGDPFEYYTDGKDWFARPRKGMKFYKGSDKWINITLPKYQKSIDTLDKEYPELRTGKKEINKPSKPQTKRELLEAIRLSIVSGIKEIEQTGKPKYESDKYCKKMDEEWFGHPHAVHNHTHFFWPILKDDHPSETYENFKNLFENYWSKRSCPSNWESSFQKFKQSLKSRAANLFPKGCLRNGKNGANDNYWSEYMSNREGDPKDWSYIYWNEHIPDLKAYGVAESDWLQLYAQYMGLVKEDQNLYEYYKSLPSELPLKTSSLGKTQDGKKNLIELVDESYLTKEFNFHLIPDGKNNYRSAQLPIEYNGKEVLSDVIDTYGIKTIIRFNGNGGDGRNRRSHPITTIDEEERLANSKGVVFYKLSSTKNQDKVNELLSKGNVLIHCAHGADRTGGNVGGYLFKTGWGNTKKIWDYSTQYSSWEHLIKTNPDGFVRHGYLDQVKKFGVRDMDHARELSK